MRIDERPKIVIQNCLPAAMYDEFLFCTDDDIVLLRKDEPSVLSFFMQRGLCPQVFVVPKKNPAYIMNIIASEVVDELSLMQSPLLFPMVSADAVQILADQLEDASVFSPPIQLTKDLDDKRYAKMLFHSLGLPTIGESLKFPAIAKKIRGRGGTDVHLIFSEEQLSYYYNDNYIIESYLDVALAPNVQFSIFGGEITLLGITDQVIHQKPEANGVISQLYGGNRYPSTSKKQKKILSYAQKIAQHLAKTGYVGIVGIDFLETKTGAVYPLEINPRLNSSTAALVFCQREKFDLFCLESFKLSFAISFVQLEKALVGLWYEQEDACGVLPYHIGLLKRGSCFLLFFGADEQKIIELREAAKQRLSCFM